MGIAACYARAHPCTNDIGVGCWSGDQQEKRNAGTLYSEDEIDLSSCA